VRKERLSSSDAFRPQKTRAFGPMNDRMTVEADSYICGPIIMREREFGPSNVGEKDSGGAVLFTQF
jgi:hypothetical protein